MEIVKMPVLEIVEGAEEDVAAPHLKDAELDRIALELWQRGSLPELAEADAAELEEVACHSSCL